MKANYHTHLSLCGHAVGMSEDYVKVAIEAGYEELGMSDHGPIKPEFMTEEEFKAMQEENAKLKTELEEKEKMLFSNKKDIFKE